MGYFAFSALINCVFGLAAGSFVYWNNRKSAANIGFAAFSFSVALWSYGYFFWLASDNATSAIFWVRVLMVGAALVPPSFYFWTLGLIGEYAVKKKQLIAAYGIFLPFILLDFTPLFVSHVEKFYWFQFLPMPGVAFHPFLVLFFGLLFYSTYLIFKKFQVSQGIIRDQIKYALIGVWIALAGGSTNYFLWYKIPIPPVTNIFASLYLVIMAYAVIRYRLMDVRIVSRKLLISLCSALFTYAVFYLVIWGYQRYLGGFYTIDAYLAGILIVPTAMFVLGSLHKLVTKFADNYLFFSLYRYQNTINRLTSEIADYNDLAKISSLIVDTIKKFMHLERAGVLLLDREKTDRFEYAKLVGFEIKPEKAKVLADYFKKFPTTLVKDELTLALYQNKSDRQMAELSEHLEKIKAAVCLPLISNGEVIGMILLGSKISGNTFSTDDLDLLNSLSGRAGTAFDNALLYAKVRDLSENLKIKVDQQTTSLKKANAELEEKSKILMEKLSEVEKMNSLMVGREIKMMELKNIIKDLEKRVGVSG